MPRSPFASVRIYQRAGWALMLGVLTAPWLASRAPSLAQGAEADPHAQHRGGAPSQAPAAPAMAAPATGSVPARSTTISTPSWFAGGEALYVPPYFDSFKGIDLTDLTATQKERFLHRVNTEFCSCNQTGCRRDTIAHCYTTDAACPRAPVRIREMLERVKAEGTGDGPAPTAPSVTITPRP